MKLLAAIRRALIPAVASLAVSACAIGGGDSGIATGALGQATDTEQPAASVAKRFSAKVAMLLPLSAPGQTGLLAKAMKQAGELALFDLDNPAFQLIVKDDKGTVEGARAAADEAVKEGAELILGPLFSSSVQAVAPVARQAKVPVVAFSNDRQAAGNGVYLMSFLAEREVERVVGYAVAQDRRRLAALVPDDAFGRLTEQAFRNAAERAMASVVAIELYQNQANGMLEATRRLIESLKRAEDEGAPVDAIFVPGGPETLATIGPMLAYAKIDTKRVKLLGSGGWDHPNLGRDAALIGGWFPAPDPNGWRSFAERFAKTFGNPPPRLASLAHDAVGMAIVLSQGQPGTRFTAAGLTRPSGFNGVDGPVRLLSDGTPERALAILEVQSFGANVVDPAPATFGPSQVSSVPSRVN